MIESHIAGQPLVGQVVDCVFFYLSQREPAAVNRQQSDFQKSFRMEGWSSIITVHLIGFFNCTGVQRIHQVVYDTDRAHLRSDSRKVNLCEQQHLGSIRNEECRHEVPPVLHQWRIRLLILHPAVAPNNDYSGRTGFFDSLNKIVIWRKLTGLLTIGEDDMAEE